MKFHDLAKKAHGGDKEALSILVIEAPRGMMDGMEPEGFAEMMANDESMCEKMGEMDHFSKNVFDAYADEHSEKGPHDLQSDLQSLLDNWTERDPNTPAGKYYEDLKMLVERQFGPQEGGEE